MQKSTTGAKARKALLSPSETLIQRALGAVSDCSPNTYCCETLEVLDGCRVPSNWGGLLPFRLAEPQLLIVEAGARDPGRVSS